MPPPFPLTTFRRAAPEVLIPQLANPAALVAGVGAFPASWTTIVASAPVPFALTSLVISSYADQFAAAVGTYLVQKTWRVAVATGPALSEVEVARATHSLGLQFLVLAGTGVSAAGYSTQTWHFPVAPVLINQGTRISARAMQEGSASGISLDLYLQGYDLAHLQPSRWPLHPDLWLKGASNSRSAVAPATGTLTVPPHPVTPWTWGSPVQVIAALDADYLIRGITVEPDLTYGVASFQDAQFQLGTGAVGLEVWRGAIAYPDNITPITMTSTLLEMDYPFLAYAGERLIVRHAGAFTYNKLIRVALDRLHQG